MQARLAIPLLLLFTASCLFRPPSEDDAGNADPQPPAVTAGDSKKPPPEDLPGDGTGNPPPEEPPGYSGVNGPLPPALCGAGSFYGVSAASPSPLTPLPENATVTVTVTVDYSLDWDDTATLGAFGVNSGAEFHAPSVNLAPGCGTVQMSITFPTTGETQFIIMVESWDASSYATSVVYDVGAQRIQIVATSIPVGSYIPATAATISVTLAYDTLGNPAEFAAWDGWDYRHYELPETAGTLTVDLYFAAYTCNQEVVAWIEMFDYSQGQSYVRMPAWYLGPGLLVDTPMTVAPGLNYFLIDNCTEADITASISSDAAWLTPGQEMEVISANSSVMGELNVDTTGLAAGTYTGHVFVSWGDQRVEREVSLSVLDDTRFLVTSVTYAWDSAADPGQGTSLFSMGADDTNALVTLPFSISVFGSAATSLYVAVNGFVSMQDMGGWCCDEQLGGYIQLNYADLYVGTSQSVRYATAGTSPNQRFVISYNGLERWSDNTLNQTFQLIFYEGQSKFRVQYGQMDSLGEAGIGDGPYTYTGWTPAGNTAFEITPQ